MSVSLSGLDLDVDALNKLSPAERAAAEQELLLLEGAFGRNPLLGYRPHGKQVPFHEPPFPSLRAFFGGNRSGKTTAVMVDTIIQCVDADQVPPHLAAYKRWKPPFKCRVITPDFGDSHEVVLEKFREWCPKDQLRGGSFSAAYNKLSRVLWFKNDSRVHFNSNVQDREQLGGSDLHRIVYDEEPRRDLRSESLTRLIDHDGEELFAMTPLNGMSFMYDEIYEPWERGVLPKDEFRVLVVDMDDNPHLSENGKRRALAQYSPEEREARKSGRFVHFAGLIYPEFQWSRHSVPQLMVPEEPGVSAVPAGVEVFAGIDPGLNNPAVVFAYLDFDDKLVVFDEILAQDKTVMRVCAEIRRREMRWRVTPKWYVIDPAARNKNGQTGRSDQQEYADHGIYTFPGQNDVRPGINRVKERLEADRLLITANCQLLRGEFKKYRWASPQVRSEHDRKEKPVKKDDHLLDALRYVVMARPMRLSESQKPVSRTMQERLLRASLAAVSAKVTPQHDSGPGIWL